MPLMNSGEVYHWGYGGHGQSGDASTSNRDHPVRVGGTNQNVYLGLTHLHTFGEIQELKEFISLTGKVTTLIHTLVMRLTKMVINYGLGVITVTPN